MTLYAELLAALGRRGLLRLAHQCEKCKATTVACLEKYPEFKAACEDAAAKYEKERTER
jgi:hypothetical protein